MALTRTPNPDRSNSVIIVSRIFYALPAWGVFMSAAQSGRIDAFLKRAHKCGFSKELLRLL